VHACVYVNRLPELKQPLGQIQIKINGTKEPFTGMSHAGGE